MFEVSKRFDFLGHDKYDSAELGKNCIGLYGCV